MTTKSLIGTPAGAVNCDRAGCGHSRIRHELGKDRCTQLVYVDTYVAGILAGTTMARCACSGYFKEAQLWLDL